MAKKSGSSEKITVLNPACSSKMTERVSLAPRTLTSLEGKTIYLVDIGWGGPEAGYDVFAVMQDWLKEHVPSIKTLLVKKRGSFRDEDPDLWNKIKSDGDACIIGISC